jgi:phosphoribosylanthranilate isomerase
MHLRIKICGLTRAADASEAARLGADAVGLNFYRGSRRQVTPETARGILRALPPLVEAVGVFVNEPVAQAASQARDLGIGTVQWHGERPPVPPAGSPRFVSAFAVKDADDLLRIDAYLESCARAGRLPAGVLVDAHVPGEYGGTGRVAPWQLLAGWRPLVPLILAGGLTAENVAEAVRLVRPFAVDVASGVESAPGCKDADKMRRFIENARAAAAAVAEPRP